MSNLLFTRSINGARIVAAATGVAISLGAFQAHAANTITFGSNNNSCGGAVMCSTDGTHGYTKDGTGQAFNLSTISQWFQIDANGSSALSGQPAEPDKGAGGFLVVNDTGSAVSSFSLTITDDFTASSPSVHKCSGTQTGNICDNFTAHGGSGSYRFNTALSGTDWDRCTQGTTSGQTCTGGSGGVAADFAPDSVTYTWTGQNGSNIPAGSYFLISFSGWNNDGWAYQAPPATWTQLASEPQPVAAAMAGVINGIIYVAGGYYNSQYYETSTALQAYDPSTNTWSTLASMPAAFDAGVAGVINGKLYVAGGQGTGGYFTALNTLYVYDPSSNTWTQKASMPELSCCGTGGVIDGKLYVQTACSNGSCGATGPFDVYDPSTDTWTPLGDSASTANGSSAVINGKLYTVTLASLTSTIVQVYDPTSNTWTQLASMPTPVTATAAVALDNKLWVFGGNDYECPNSMLVQVYDPAQDQWTTYSPSMPIGLSAESAEVASGDVYVQGESSYYCPTGGPGINLGLIP